MADLIGYRLDGLWPVADSAWTLAGPRGRRKAFEFAAEVGKRAKLAELAAGLDKNGKPLRAIHPKTVIARAEDRNPVTGRQPYSPMGRANPANHPLQATGGRSRTRTLLIAIIDDDGVLFTWGHDYNSGVNWSLVLARHAAGFYQRFADGEWGYVPPRDVIGLSPRYAAWVKAQFDAWWLANRKALARDGLTFTGGVGGLKLDAAAPSRAKARATPTKAARAATKPPRRPPGTKPTGQWVEIGGTVVNMQTQVSGPWGGSGLKFGQFIAK